MTLPSPVVSKKSTNIPCMTPQWRHKWHPIKNTKITKNRQNHGFSLFFSLFFQVKLHFLAMMCVKVCLHMFLFQINQINKIKHSESVSWKKKHDLCVISIENQFLVSFLLEPVLYHATPRHNPRFNFLKNGLKFSARLKKKVMKFQREKITTCWDITKNVEGGGFRPPPPGSFKLAVD